MAQRPINQKVAVSVVYVAAMFMTIMDTTIVNVALPTLGRQFHVVADGVDTVAIAFLVSLAVCIPASGWLGDRLGGRPVLLGSIVIFTAASALCGLSHSLAALVGFRVLQGVGGGLMTPVGMAMLYRVFPPSERIRAAGILTVPTALAPAAGPVLGGLLVTDLSWRWVFFVNVPIGAAAVLFGLVFLADRREAPPGRFDLAGFCLAGAGFGAFMYGVSEGPVKGWGQPAVVATLAAGMALIAAMVLVELRKEEPLVDLATFRDDLFRNSSIVILLASVSFLGALFGLALFYQDGLGMSALGSGLSTFPEAVGVMVGVQFVTRRLFAAVGPSRLMAAGLLVVAAGMALLALVQTIGDLWWARALVFCMGLGMSAVFVPSTTVAFATIPRDATGRASTLFNAERQLGGAAGVAVLTTVIAAVGPVRHLAGRAVPNLAAYHDAFLAGAGVAVAAALVALTVDDRQAVPADGPAAARAWDDQARAGRVPAASPGAETAGA